MSFVTGVAEHNIQTLYREPPVDRIEICNDAVKGGQGGKPQQRGKQFSEGIGDIDRGVTSAAENEMGCPRAESTTLNEKEIQK